MVLDSLPTPVRDAVYVAIGLPVVVAQDLRERQQELAADLDQRLAPLRDRATAAGRDLAERVPQLGTAGLGEHDLSDLNTRIEQRVKVVEERLAEVEERMDHLLDRVEEQLPEAAREMMAQARGAAKEARAQLRRAVGRPAPENPATEAA